MGFKFLKLTEKEKREMIKNLIIQFIVGLVIALFNFWLTKTFGYELNIK